jgi:hypothetical protein
MRKALIALKFVAVAAASTMFCNPVPAAVAAPAQSVAGAWEGPFVGTTFTFEFTQSDAGWTGRSKSEKYGKWENLHDVSFADGILRFRFDSKPPLSFTLRIDEAGNTLTGSTSFASRDLPVTLTRQAK